MNKKKAYYKKLDIVRVISCIAVLLYHLNVLKGGFLAVCIFFVLSGYLSCFSLFNKDKVDLGKYYLNRLKKIYLPLVMVVFMTVGVLSLFPGIVWLNLKPETTSVLFGYNNWWQLSVNADYFARSADSPFVHFWYLGILMQFDLVFPFIFMGFKKLADKVSKSISCGVIGIITILSTLLFIIMSFKANIMVVYYNTFIRVFSLLFGVLVGFNQHYHGPINSKKSRNSDIKFWIYIALIVIMCLFIDSSSKLFVLGMIGTTIISCRLIDLAYWSSEKKISKIDYCIKGLGDISYEVYLVQYPIIFIVSYFVLEQFAIVPIVIVLTLEMALLIHFGLLDLRKVTSYKKVKGIVLAILTVFSLYGGIRFIMAPDHSEELAELRQQLEDAQSQIDENEELVKQSQEEYEAKLKEEEENWQKILNGLEVNEEEIKKQVDNVQIVAVGDSVMLGAVNNMKKLWANGHFDAKVSRGMGAGVTILKDLKTSNRLGNPIIVHLGTNGGFSKANFTKIMDLAEERDVYFLTTTYQAKVGKQMNENIREYCPSYENCHIIDWYQYVEDWRKEHEEELKSKKITDLTYADGIHLRPGKGSGREEYAKLIYDSIYNTYVEKINERKEAAIKAHEAETLNTVGFFGNELLLGSYETLKDKYKDALFVTNKDYNYKTLKKELETKIKDGTLTYKVVLVFDKSANISNNQWSKIMDLLAERKVYFVLLEKTDLENIWNHVTFIDFYKKIEKNPDYLLMDGTHLSVDGNKTLCETIVKKIK